MIWKKLFLINIFVLPLSFALNPTQSIDLSILRSTIPLTTLSWFLFKIKKNSFLPDFRLRFFALIVLLFISGLSLFWTKDLSAGLRKFLFLVSISSFYLPAKEFFLSSKNPFDEFSRLLNFSSLLAGSFALLLFFLQFIIGLDATIELLANYVAPFFLGQNFSALVRNYPSWMVNISGQTLLRTVGSFPDPHILSIYFNLCWPIILYQWLKTKELKFLISLSLIITSILLSFSRASYLALTGGVFFLIIHPHGLRLIQKNQKMIILSIICLSILVLPISPIGQRFWESFNLQEGSNSGRLEMWKRSSEVFFQNPIKGVGLAGFPKTIDPLAQDRNSIYAHNLLLDFSSELGIIGSISVIILLFAPIANYLKTPTNEKLFISTSLVTFIISCIFETPFFSVNVFPLWLILLAI